MLRKSQTSLRITSSKSCREERVGLGEGLGTPVMREGSEVRRCCQKEGSRNSWV